MSVAPALNGLSCKFRQIRLRLAFFSLAKGNVYPNGRMNDNGGVGATTAAEETPGRGWSPRILGTLCVIASAVGFGALGILGKTAYQSGPRP